MTTQFATWWIVQAATTGALPACTVNTGVNPITLTANSNGAFPTIDGITLSLNDYVLVKNQSDQTQNWVYQLTQVGDGSHPWILSNADGYVSGTSFYRGAIPVALGNTYGGPPSPVKTGWAVTFLICSG